MSPEEEQVYIILLGHYNRDVDKVNKFLNRPWYMIDKINRVTGQHPKPADLIKSGEAAELLRLLRICKC